MKKKAIFLGGAFREHQILYMLPILDGFCKQKKITRIIFEKKIPNSIQNISFVRVEAAFEGVYEKICA